MNSRKWENINIGRREGRSHIDRHDDLLGGIVNTDITPAPFSCFRNLGQTEAGGRGNLGDMLSSNLVSSVLCKDAKSDMRSKKRIKTKK